VIEEVDCDVSIRAAPTPVWPSAVRVWAKLRLCGSGGGSGRGNNTDVTATLSGVLLGMHEGRLPVRDVECDDLGLVPSLTLGAFRAICKQAIGTAGSVEEWSKVEFQLDVHADGDLFSVVEILNEIAASDR